MNETITSTTSTTATITTATTTYHATTAETTQKILVQLRGNLEVRTGELS